MHDRLLSLTVRNCRDVDEQAECLSGYDAYLEQLTPGRFSARFLTIDYGDQTSLHVDHSGAALRSKLRVPKGMAAVVVLLRGASDCLLQGHRVAPSAFTVLPPGCHADFISRAGSVFGMLSAPADRLMPAVTGGTGDGEGTKPFVVTVSGAGEVDAGLLHLKAVLGAAAARLSGDAVRGQRLGEAEIPNPLATISSLLAAEAATAAIAGLQATMWDRVVGEMETALLQRRDVEWLSDRLGVSRRSLELIFKRAVGVAPARYLKVLRLNNIRRDLKSPDYNDVAVGMVARNWGITHAGRFADEYRDMFGELPSETRSCTVREAATSVRADFRA